jgi:hypothetical protein
MVAGDFPAMVVGAGAGSIAGGGFGAGVGAAAGPVTSIVGAAAGATVGAGAGGMALPAALRASLVEQYTKGDLQSFEDFWARTAAVTIETAKAGTLGAVTSVAGPLARMGTAGAGPIVQTTSGLTAEIATMTVIGKALEGETPDAEDFIESAIVVGGMHGASAVLNKSLNVYKATGVPPAKLVEAAKSDPVLLQEMAYQNQPIPKTLEPLIEPGVKMPEQIRQKLDKDGAEFVVERIKPKEEPVASDTPEIKTWTPQEKVLAKVLSSAEKAKEKYNPDRLIEDTIDYLYPLKVLEKQLLGKESAKNLKIEESAYGLARTMAGHEGQVQAWLEFGPAKYLSGERTGTRGIGTILKEMGEETRNEYRAYAVSLRALELEKRGIKTGVDLPSAEAVVNSASPKVKAYQKEILQFRNESLQVLVDSGIVKKEVADSWMKDSTYVPFHRLIEGEAAGAKAGSGRSVSDPIKAIKGSDTAIIDPLEMVIKDAAVFLKLAERNKLLKNIIFLAEKDLDVASAIGIRKTPIERKPIEVTQQEIAKAVKEQGVSTDTPIEAFNIFRPNKTPLAQNEIALYRNGKREIWEVNPEVKRALDNMDYHTSNIFLQTLNGFSKALKTGVSLSPDFIARNPIRDQISAFTVSKNGYLPLWDAVKGLGSIIKKDEAYQKWLYSGGANSAFTTFDVKSLALDLATLDKQTGIIKSTWNVITKPVHFIELTAQLAENSTRVGEFKRALKKGKSAKQAAYESRDLIDFAKVGAKGRAVNQIIAFWNAPLQGRARLVEGLIDDPVGVGARVTASMVVPTVLLWWAQKDDERIQETPMWVQDNFWVVATDKWEDVDPKNPPKPGHLTRVVNGKTQVNNGILYRIPMSQDTAVVSAMTRRALDAYYKNDPEAFRDFGKTVMALGEVGYMPNAFAPVIEQITNHSFFTDRPLVPHHMIDGPNAVLPAYRYSPYTTETAKQLGQMIQAIPGGRELGIASPIVIENYIRHWSGTNGMYALQLADQALIKSGFVEDPVRPSTAPGQGPFEKAFTVRYPSANANSIEEFRKEYQSTYLRINTLKDRMRKMDFVGYEKEREAAEAEGKLVAIKGLNDSLSKVQKIIRDVTNNKDISPDEKRQLIDGLTFQMIEVTRGANEQIKEINMSLKQVEKNK